MPEINPHTALFLLRQALAFPGMEKNQEADAGEGGEKDGGGPSEGEGEGEGECEGESKG